jgi:hypothetical protein
MGHPNASTITEIKRERVPVLSCSGSYGDWSRELQRVKPYSLQGAGKESLWLGSSNSFCQTMGWELRL